MIDLSGHAALVTGGTQGVGAAIALSLAQCGAQVILHGKQNDEHAKQTLLACQQLQPTSQAIFVDLLQPIDTVRRELFEQSIAIQPRINLLVNNAGAFIDKPFLEMDLDTYERTFHLNVTVGYFLTQFFANRWIDNGVRGRILFTGSINGLLAEPDHTAYDASKAAVAGMVRSLCVALAPKGIRVNSMAPGLVRTPLTNQVLSQNPSVLHWMKLHTPNGQVPEASVCGPTAAFLLSDLAEHIHGQTIYVDGGMSSWQQPDLPTS